MKDLKKCLFKPASGLVVELYRNSLLAEQEIRFPFAYCEIALQDTEEKLLKSIHQEGLFLTNLTFRNIDLDQPMLPKLNIGISLLPKEMV